MPDLPFHEGDRVKATVKRRRHDGQVVTVNHDNPDQVIFLVAFDEPVGLFDDGSPERTVWVPADQLKLVQLAADWAHQELRRLADEEPTDAVLDRMTRIRSRYLPAPVEDWRTARQAALLGGVE